MPFTNQKSNKRKFKTLLGVLVLVFVIVFFSSAAVKIEKANAQRYYQLPPGSENWYVDYLSNPEDINSLSTLGPFNTEQEAKTAYTNAAPSVSGIAKESAQAVGGYVYYALLRAFAWVCDLILYIFSYLVSLGGVLLDIAIAITSKLKFTQSQIVQAGWPIVRDLANMFFALILLVIAFATILRLESYGMKAILWRLVVAALLINFSLVIAGVIIDGSHVLTGFFLSNRFEMKGGGQTASISEAILNNLQVTSFWKTDPKSGNVLQGASSPNSPGFMAIALNAILGIILMLVTAFVLLSAAILFLVRMVALWILLIFAPLAWLAMVLPATRSIWNKWWNEFIKWVIFAPVYAFFIYLTVFLMSKNILLGNPAINEAVSQANSTWSSSVNFIFNTFFQSFQIVVNYIVLVIFMVAGLFFARQAGIHGAASLYNATVSMRKSAGRGVSRWAASGAPLLPQRWSKQALEERAKKAEEAGRTGRAAFYRRMAGVTGVAEKIGAPKRFIARMASPKVWARAWSEMQKRADESAFGKPAGSIVDMWQAIKKLSPSDFKKAISQEGTLATLQHQRETARREDEFAKALKDEHQTVDAYLKAIDPVDKEALARRVTAFNGWNTVFTRLGKELDFNSLREYLKDVFGDTAEGARITADISSIGVANGYFNLAGVTKWDPKLGRNRFAEPQEHEDIIMAKMSTTEPQQLARTTHPDVYIVRGSDGTPIGLSSAGERFFRDEFTALHKKHFDRTQPRVINALSTKRILDRIDQVNGVVGEEIRSWRKAPQQQTPQPLRQQPPPERNYPERM